MHGVAVQGDRRHLADLLELGAREAVRPQVPKDEVVVRAVAGELVALRLQRLGEGVRVGHDMLRVLLELRRAHLQKLRGQRADLVVVRATLQPREHRHVDALLDVRQLVAVLEEDHTRPRAAEGLVRRRRHHVAVLEGRRVQARGDEAADVGDVRHQVRADLVGDLAELLEVHDPRVGRGAAEDHLRPEHEGRLPQLLEIDEARLRVDLVWQRLEVDRRRRDLLLRRVVPVRQVPAARQVQAHDARVRRQQRRVDREVRRAARIRLHVHPPLLLVQAEGLQGAVLAQVLDAVDDLVAAVVARAGLALGVLVRERRAEALHHRAGGEVLRRDELDGSHLPGLLLLDQLRDRRVRLSQRPVPGELRAGGHLPKMESQSPAAEA
mmetsp:Transcript_37835/g.75400  ORF Transcript_37835/g.75400 Transcript_37835/m.75400 type:complete len:381 (-) Transcript_37835:18-1160(-)